MAAVNRLVVVHAEIVPVEVVGRSVARERERGVLPLVMFTLTMLDGRRVRRGSGVEKDLGVLVLQVNVLLEQ